MVKSELGYYKTTDSWVPTSRFNQTIKRNVYSSATHLICGIDCTHLKNVFSGLSTNNQLLYSIQHKWNTDYSLEDDVQKPPMKRFYWGIEWIKMSEYMLVAFICCWQVSPAVCFEVGCPHFSKAHLPTTLSTEWRYTLNIKIKHVSYLTKQSTQNKWRSMLSTSFQLRGWHV